MSDKIREDFEQWIVEAHPAGKMRFFLERVTDGSRYASMEAEWAYRGYMHALAQQPAPAVPEDLRVRCAEIIAWQKTGVLKGDALRGYAAAQFYADEHNSLQLAEDDTARQAYALLAAAPPAAEQPDTVKVPRHTVEGAIALIETHVPFPTAAVFELRALLDKEGA